MGWDTYARSKMPLKLVWVLIVAVAVNFGIVLSFQALVTYRHTEPIDGETLAKFDSRYEGSEIVDMTWDSVSDSDITVYLVEMPDGQYHLVTAHKHYLFDRYRFVKNGCIALEPDQSSVRLRSGTTFFNIELRYKEGVNQPDIVWTGMSGISGRNAFTNSMMLSIAALCAIELAAYCLLFKRHELL